jgi:hypothetical protein
MKKLTTKQQKIIKNVKDSIAIDLSVMEDFKAEDDYKMTKHCQKHLLSKLDGISSFLIYHESKNWDAIKDIMWEIRQDHRLQSEWAWEIQERV